MAEVDSSFAPVASAATAQVTIAAIVTAFTCPLITAMLDKRMRRLKKGIYSDEAIAEQAAKAQK